VFSVTPRPLFTPAKDPVPIVQEARWAPGPVWTGGKSRPHRDSIPDRPARSSVAIPTELPGPRHVYGHTQEVTYTNSLRNLCARRQRTVIQRVSNLYGRQSLRCSTAPRTCSIGVLQFYRLTAVSTNYACYIIVFCQQNTTVYVGTLRTVDEKRTAITKYSLYRKSDARRLPAQSRRFADRSVGS